MRKNQSPSTQLLASASANAAASRKGGELWPSSRYLNLHQSLTQKHVHGTARHETRQPTNAAAPSNGPAPHKSTPKIFYSASVWKLFETTSPPSKQRQHPVTASPSTSVDPITMSLNIPQAPNSGLFKQGYNKYATPRLAASARDPCAPPSPQETGIMLTCPARL